MAGAVVANVVLEGLALFRNHPLDDLLHRAVRTLEHHLLSAVKPVVTEALGQLHAAPAGAATGSHQRLEIGVAHADRKSVVSGKSVSVRVDLGCSRIIKKKKQQ